MPPHNYRSRSSSSGASSPMTLSTAKPRHRHIAILAAPHLHNRLTLATTLQSHQHQFVASDGHEHTTVARVLPQPPPGLETVCPTSRSRLTWLLLLKRHQLRPRLCTSISVTPPQPQVSTTQVGTHPVRSATTYKRSASTALAGTHNPVGADPSCRNWSFS